MPHSFVDRTLGYLEIFQQVEHEANSHCLAAPTDVILTAVEVEFLQEHTRCAVVSNGNEVKRRLKLSPLQAVEAYRIVRY
jgi:hypothetical protein